jgi:hypothetical protein
VQLYEMDGNGDEVLCSDWKWTYEHDTDEDGNAHGTIKATVPDGKKLILKYAYEVKCEKLTSSNSGKKIELSNTVELTDVKNGSSGTNTEFSWTSTGTSAGATTSFSYRFYKVDEENFTNTLSGAVFTLYKDGSSKPVTDANGDPVTYTTDSEGTFSIAQGKEGTGDFLFDSDTLYYVKETTAPEGYQLPDDPEKYYFYFSGKETFTVPDGITAVNLSVSSGSETVKNTVTEEPAYHLPETGGTGYKWPATGLLLVVMCVGAAFLMYRKQHKL